MDSKEESGATRNSWRHREIIFPKVEIKQIDDTQLEHFSVKIDGKEFDTVKNIDISLGVNKIPIVKMEFYASVNFQGDSNLNNI